MKKELLKIKQNALRQVDELRTKKSKINDLYEKCNVFERKIELKYKKDHYKRQEYKFILKDVRECIDYLDKKIRY